MLVFVAYLGSLQSQIRILARTYPSLQDLSARIRRVDEILQTAPEVADRPGAVALPRVAGEIVFEDVGFAYEPGRPVLKGVSFRAAPGETLALVGPTGAGKSTLVSLIPRFFDPVSGRVLIDGHDLREVRLASLRRQVAIVLQEPFLFPISVAENIAYGRPDAAMAEIEAAARAANAHDFITRLPDGYATVLGERGGSLSGGERQRLSIARAILKDAPILILDEPTSALDAETEHLVIDALRRLMAGRTTLIIAHRLSTVRRADRVMVIRDGSTAEIGTHQELMRLGGLYARYIRLQQLPQAETPSPQ
jgi:ATP-binding cassette subfamily B protein/subfamily B ATP-binding cassette protein MsbA